MIITTLTTGEKLSDLRRKHGYTQEELAEKLGVSRQAVSKWESGAAYPETEKLIKLADLYGTSTDYLLRDGFDGNASHEDRENGERSSDEKFSFTNWCFERKSKKEIDGIPLWHVNFGLHKTAKGIIAVGFRARGVLAFGLLPLGVISVGVLPLGIISFGALALGILALGAIALGVVSVGALSFGLLAVGAAAFGGFSVGALAVGHWFAYGDHASGMVAIGKTFADGSVYAATSLKCASEGLEILQEQVPAIFLPLVRVLKLIFAK